MVPGYSNDTVSCKYCGAWRDVDKPYCHKCKKNDSGETVEEVKAFIDQYFVGDKLEKLIELFDKKMSGWG